VPLKLVTVARSLLHPDGWRANVESAAGREMLPRGAIERAIGRITKQYAALGRHLDVSLVVDGGKIVEYRVAMKVTFMVDAPSKSAAK